MPPRRNTERAGDGRADRVGRTEGSGSARGQAPPSGRPYGRLARHGRGPDGTRVRRTPGRVAGTPGPRSREFRRHRARSPRARAATGRSLRYESPGPGERSTGDRPPRRSGPGRRRGSAPSGGKKRRPVMVRLLGGLTITVWTLYAAPRPRSGQGRGVEGTGLYPELAAYRISDGCSPNVQAEIGRLVGLLPIATARTELARRGLKLDEKAVRRIASELGTQMLAVRTRALLRFRTGTLAAGTECAGKRIAVQIDGGRVRIRTTVKRSRVRGKRTRRKFRIAWREPKVLIIYELDERGRMVRGSRPVIDGTLQGPG